MEYTKNSDLQPAGITKDRWNDLSSSQRRAWRYRYAKAKEDVPTSFEEILSKRDEKQQTELLSNADERRVPPLGT